MSEPGVPEPGAGLPQAPRERSPNLPPPEQPRAAPPPQAATPAPAAAPKAPPPPPSPPSFVEIVEAAFVAVANAPGVFAGLAARPAPAAGAPLGVALVLGAFFFALNVTHGAAAHPALVAGILPWQIAAAAGAGFALLGALYFLSAAVVFALGKMLGSEGDFGRALLVAAVSSVAAPVAGACLWLPEAWFVPAALAAWIASCGVAALFKANAWVSRAACLVLAGGFLACQYGLRVVAERKLAEISLASSAYEASAAASQLATDMQAMQRQMQAVQEQAALAPATAPGASGLDLLRGPADAAPGSAPATPAQMAAVATQATEQGQAMTKNVLGMIEAMEPMLSNPLLTKSMTPAQKQDFRELQETIKDLKASMATGAKVNPAQQQQRMLKVQNLMMSMMAAGAGMPAPAAAGAAAPPASGTKP